MKRGLLNSPTDGNGSFAGMQMQGMRPANNMRASRQSLSGSDGTGSTNYDRPPGDCGCGDKRKAYNQPPPNYAANNPPAYNQVPYTPQAPASTDYSKLYPEYPPRIPGINRNP